MRPRAQVALTIFVVLFAAGCSRGGERKPINISDYESGASLSATLKQLVPPGTPVARARSLMEESGFECGERAGIVVDQRAGRIGSGKPRLECWESSRIWPGLQRRDWTVVIRYDSSGVVESFGSFIIQP